MASHAGAVFFDEGPALDARGALAAGLHPVSPDGVSAVVTGSVAMAHGALHTWTGDREARQPVRSPGRLLVTFDGRIDNRTDLLLQLGSPPGSAIGDASLAAAVFERWGIDGLRFVVGEWSLAVWDPAARTLHLARDGMGVRPLYYVHDSESVLWSSSLGELAIRSGRVDALDDAFVAGFVTLRFSSEITPYEGIRLIPAGHCLSFRAGSVVRRQYWALAPATIRYRDPHEYEEHLRTLWIDAVGARLRTTGAVWAELSGGFDSSAVVCMADYLIRTRSVAAALIQPVSHATLESPEGDERRFIAEVEARTGTRSEILGAEAHQHAADEEWDWVTPHMIRGVGLVALQRARDSGARVLLSGRLGDLVMGCQPDNSIAVLDDLTAGHPLRALSAMRRWSRATRKPFVEIARELRRRSSARAIVAAFAEDKDCARALGLLTPRLRGISLGDGSAIARAAASVRPAKREMAAQLVASALRSSLTIPEIPPGIVYTYPFAHRPLLEFVMAIPGEQLSAPGEMRWLMRRAFAGLLPARVLQRISKGYYPPFLARATRRQADALGPIAQLEVVRREWIEPAALDAAVRALIAGGSTSEPVRQVLRLEQWLTSRTRRAPAAIPRRKEVRSHEVLNA